MRPAVICPGSDPIRTAAMRIDESTQSYLLVETDRGLGIVTDHDFRRLVARDTARMDAPVAELASVPALTIDQTATAGTALLRMVEHGVHHLVVADEAGFPIGVVRTVDLAQFELREPIFIRAAIDTASDLDALAEAGRAIPPALVELRSNGVPARHVGALHAALVETVLKRALALRADPVLAALRHSWILLGSLARREPLPNSDLDTALLWADTTSTDLADEMHAAASQVMSDLRHCGLTPCPNGASADNPLFSRSESAWTRAAITWMHDPNTDGALLLSAMVTDSRPITDEPLGRRLTDNLMSHTRTSQFLRALLDEAVAWRTSTGTFRDFLVSHDQAHRGQLDLKRGGLVPVIALGRWIAIVTGNVGGDTPDRLARGAAAGLITDDEQHTLTGGFESIYTILYDLEVQALRSGGAPTTYVRPRDLDSLTHRHLRETLRAIKKVQVRVDQSWVRRLDR
jgi:CBS domain-containing protein